MDDPVSVPRAALQFVRFSAFTFSALLPLFGVASVTAHPDPLLLIGLLAVALFFHCFTFVLNDVVDVEIDASHAQRSGTPLVAGTVSRRTAIVFVCAQVGLAFAVSGLLGAGPTQNALLFGAFCCLGIYDLWGKRFSLPLLADIVQGVGWSLLVPYAALFERPGELGATTALLTIWVVVFIVLVNAIHGGLKDLENDIRHGASTTAIALGCVADAEGRPLVSAGVRILGYALQTTTVGLGVWVALLHRGELAPEHFDAALAAYGVAAAGSLGLLVMVLHPQRFRWDYVLEDWSWNYLGIILVHTWLSLIGLGLLLLPAAGNDLRVAFVFAYVVSALASRRVHRALRMLRERVFG